MTDGPFRSASSGSVTPAQNPGKRVVSKKMGAPLDTDTTEVWVEKRNKQIAAQTAQPTPISTAKAKRAVPPPNDNDTAEEWVDRRYAQIAKKKAMGFG